MIRALDGDDFVNARGGDDVSAPGRAERRVQGDYGSDRAYGGAGRRLAARRERRRHAVGRLGERPVHGGQGADELHGGTGNDVVRRRSRRRPSSGSAPAPTSSGAAPGTTGSMRSHPTESPTRSSAALVATWPTCAQASAQAPGSMGCEVVCHRRRPPAATRQPPRATATQTPNRRAARRVGGLVAGRAALRPARAGLHTK